jgi:hypothetical protein
MDVYEPQPVEELAPNLNTATISGRLTKVEPMSGKTAGMTFEIAYRKTWPNGHTDLISIPCVVTGSERIDKIKSLKVGELVIVRGEATNRGNIYAFDVQPWISPVREAGDDAYIAGMQRSRSA